jgi:hypothetical protein
MTVFLVLFSVFTFFVGLFCGLDKSNSLGADER